MSVISTQGINYQLVAGDDEVILDLFSDEEILLSDNVTGVFDLGLLPSEFTRQITLPGTKKNNAFFEHYYDISVLEPELFSTNVKVPCFLDFGGIYLAQGYIQLSKVTLLENKFIDSYEVTIYGTLSSFAREINRNFLTDLTSLSKYNHTASLENITGSWTNGLFDGDIIYPMAEFGQQILYLPQDDEIGIESPSGSLFVQDYKPAIRIREVWNAIFEEYGFTYTGDFWDKPFLNNVYMVLNNKLRYPIFEEVDLETFGLGKIGPIEGATDIFFNDSTTFSQSVLPWANIQSNPAGNFDEDVNYSLEFPSKLRGKLNLNFRASGSDETAATPQFSLVVKDLQNNVVDITELPQLNTAMDNLHAANLTVFPPDHTRNEKFTILSEFNTGFLPSGSYKFFLEYSQLGTGNMTAIVDPDGELKSFLEITKVGNVGEGLEIDIAKNMPFGTKGIKQIDFITAIQKKFNLVIYPSKIKRNEFTVRQFNEWYKDGEQVDFNQFINIDKPVEFIPANNFAPNELEFGDTLDNDYISQQFSKQENREYAKTYFVDTTNFYSQGQFKVESSFASSPLVYLDGTGVSGSIFQVPQFISVDDETVETSSSTCEGSLFPLIINKTTVTLLDANGVEVINYKSPISVLVKYDLQECGTTSDAFATITIPYGVSSASINYIRSVFINCEPIPQLPPDCRPKNTFINCVQSFTPVSLQIASTSPIPAC